MFPSTECDVHNNKTDLQWGPWHSSPVPGQRASERDGQSCSANPDQRRGKRAGCYYAQLFIFDHSWVFNFMSLLSKQIIVKEIEVNEWKRKYEESRAEVMEMRYEAFVCLSAPVYVILNTIEHVKTKMTVTALGFYSDRKIVAEYEKTVAQMIGKLLPPSGDFALHEFVIIHYVTAPTTVWLLQTNPQIRCTFCFSDLCGYLYKKETIMYPLHVVFAQPPSDYSIHNVHHNRCMDAMQQLSTLQPCILFCICFFTSFFF